MRQKCAPTSSVESALDWEPFPLSLPGLSKWECIICGCLLSAAQHYFTFRAVLTSQCTFSLSLLTVSKARHADVMVHLLARWHLHPAEKRGAARQAGHRTCSRQHYLPAPIQHMGEQATPAASFQQKWLQQPSCAVIAQWPKAGGTTPQEALHACHQ